MVCYNIHTDSIWIPISPHEEVNMKTEKVSVNLNPVELGQIDYLVERGLFDNRSDFMRYASRKTLESYSSDIQQFVAPPPTPENNIIETHFCIGANGIARSEIDDLVKAGKKIRIRTIGILHISDKVTPEEIKQVVLSCKVYGKIIASDEVKQALDEIAERGN